MKKAPCTNLLRRDDRDPRKFCVIDEIRQYER